MKKLIPILVLTISFSAFSQIYDPVKWDTSIKKISSKEVELIVTATIEDDWHLYSQFVPEDGPIPTIFTFENNPNYLKKGNTREEEGITIHDKIFNMKIKYFIEKATFKQRIKLKSENATSIKAAVEFMLCNDSQCLPPKEVDLLFDI